MSPAEDAVYEALQRYIEEVYRDAPEDKKGAVGFVLAIYRRRLASSFQALRRTLEKRLEELKRELPLLVEQAHEDEPGDEAADEEMDTDEVEALEREARLYERRAALEDMLASIRRLPIDTKFRHLSDRLQDLRVAGFRQAMVFTQYTDTMDFVRDRLAQDGATRVMCFSGRGGEVREPDGSWRVVSRDDIKRRFRDGEADILVCTDAAAEGLNFQFCGALVNYDMPWNPMRVEQRIGRIDRLGQAHPSIRVENLHYQDTIETDVYIVLRDRIGLFESVVGRLQPILSRLPRIIASAVLGGRDRAAADRAAIVGGVRSEVETRSEQGFDIDEVTAEDLRPAARPVPRLTLSDLERVLATPSVLPPGTRAGPLSPRDSSYTPPGGADAVRVTLDPEFFEENAGSLELWSPGSPAFPQPDVVADPSELVAVERLGDLL
jgi:hypothetical protein